MAAVGLVATPVFAAGLPETIKQIKPSVVGVGTFQATRRPPVKLMATGFAVANGLHIITNAHVIHAQLDSKSREKLIVLVGEGRDIEQRVASVVRRDDSHDLALLRIEGQPLPALALGDDSGVVEGQTVAFTGFPIGVVLGLHPVTHRSLISSITPFISPQLSGRQLDVKTIRRLQKPFTVFQLDAVAYPGNSGSPLYDPSTGAVYGVLNSVFVKEAKERVLKDPSGIAYAIPIRHAKALLDALQLR